jgi:hypothetical protein
VLWIQAGRQNDMNSADFTFACPLPIPSGDPPPTPAPLLTTFNANPAKNSGGRAEAQSRYRTRNQEAERDKARRRMQQLRQGRKVEETERLQWQASSERLRSTCACSFQSVTKGCLKTDRQSSICPLQITR